MSATRGGAGPGHHHAGFGHGGLPSHLAVLIRLVWAPTDRLAADLLSKNLGTAKFQQFQRYVLGLPAGKPVRTLVTRVVSSWL